MTDNELRDLLEQNQRRVEAALDRFEEMLERFLRGQHGNGNPPQA